jgi:hypothetical protein
MTKPLYVCAITISLVAACSSSAQQPPTTIEAVTPPSGSRADAQQVSKGTNVSSDAGLVADFKKRVDDYVKLREKAESAAPVELEKKSQPAEIAMAEKSMAHNVRMARANAKRGDFFTPATQAMFRRLLRPPLAKGPDAADNKAIIKDDAPEPKEVPFKVNAEYPKDVPLSTVPPDVLLALPALPKDVQYRFAGKHLLLFDAKANIIVDFMLNAMP